MRLEDRDTVPTITFGDKEIPITKIKTKQLYSLRNKTSIIPTAFTRWQNEGLGQPSWSVVMNIPYHTVVQSGCARLRVRTRRPRVALLPSEPFSAFSECEFVCQCIAYTASSTGATYWM